MAEATFSWFKAASFVGALVLVVLAIVVISLVLRSILPVVGTLRTMQEACMLRTIRCVWYGTSCME